MQSLCAHGLQQKHIQAGLEHMTATVFSTSIAYYNEQIKVIERIHHATKLQLQHSLPVDRNADVLEFAACCSAAASDTAKMAGGAITTRTTAWVAAVMNTYCEFVLIE
jgi:hypothetical protein